MSENGTCRILVVDDEPEIRENLLLLLQGAGYDTAAVEGGAQALTAIAEIKPHVLVTDRDMPKMNGEKLAENAKRIAPEIRIIMITGRGTEAVREAATAAGVDRILSKPFRIEDLEAAIEGVLAQRA